MSMVEQGFSSIASFLTGIIIAHVCDMVTAGNYALILSVSMVALGIQRTIVALPFNVHYPKLQNEEKKKEYLSSTLGIETIFLILSAIISIIVGLSGVYNACSLSLVVFSFGYLLKDFGRQFFFAVDKVDRCLAMSLAQCFLQVGALVILKNRLTLDSVLMIVGLSSIVCTALTLLPYVDISLNPNKLLETWKRNWWTAKWSIGISMSDSIKGQLSIWLLNFFQSTKAVAIYNNNNTLGSLPQPIFNGLSQYLLPNLSAMIDRESSKTIRKKIYSACGFAIGANTLWSIALVAAGELLIKLLYGETYFVGAWPLLICCIRGVFVSLNNIHGAVLQAYQKPQIIVFTLAFGLAFLATGGVVLIWKCGIIGVCLAMLIVYLIPAVIGAFQIYKLTGEQRNGK